MSKTNMTVQDRKKEIDQINKKLAVIGGRIFEKNAGTGMYLHHFSELCGVGWSDFSNSSKELIKAKTALTCSSFIFSSWASAF